MCIQSVSYTHLDVYKRQVRDRVPDACCWAYTIYSLILLKRASPQLVRHYYAALQWIGIHISPVILGQPTFDDLVEEPLRIVCFKLAVTL